MIYMPKQNVIFGGVNLLDYGAFSIYCNVLDTPRRSVNVLDVPGRNGSLLFDNGKYDDVARTYVIVCDTYDHLRTLTAALAAVVGYARLTDGYDPDMYMTARLDGFTSPIFFASGCRIEVRFVRKPQKFLVLGESLVAYEKNAKLSNPTNYTALPLVRVTGTGTVTIGSETITINSNSSYIDIDCETQNAFNAGTNLNGNISLTSGAFFSLKPGSSGLTYVNSITEVKIAPRWWTL